MKNLFFILSFLYGFLVQAQSLEPFKIFTGAGKTISDKKFIKKISQADVVLFGELHDNSIAHWLELKITQAVYKKRPVILGMEMFETDNQHYLDQYLAHAITLKQLDSLARLWPNFTTDYKPLVDFSRANRIPVIATNIPRRYASLLYKQGEDALLNLPDTDKQWFPELPMPYDANLPAYKAMLSMFADATHANSNFPKSQAIKDYTMATQIATHVAPNTTFIHFNGAYHSNNFEGIYWYLKKQNPELKIITISTVEQSDINKLASKNFSIANFIIVTDADTIKTF